MTDDKKKTGEHSWAAETTTEAAAAIQIPESIRAESLSEWEKLAHSTLKASRQDAESFRGYGNTGPGQSDRRGDPARSR